MKLSPGNHDRDVAGLTYVYPVVSRRAGGVSVGINLSPDNACNWQCVYCQVPDLVRGKAPETAQVPGGSRKQVGRGQCGSPRLPIAA